MALGAKQIIGIIAISLLVIGIGVGVYLVQRQQTIKSGATGGSGNFVTAFEMKDASGSAIRCDSSTNPPTCTTPSLDINVKVATTTPLLP